MKERCAYIDALKGFAILLVVMGHVLAWFWGDYRNGLQSAVPVTLLWRIIYSFHMPLFMFCSGIVFVKPFEWYTIQNIGSGITKRGLSLLLPYFCMGGILYFVTGEGFKYWFLWALFFYCLFFYVVEYSIACVGRWMLWIESSVLLICSFLVLRFSPALVPYQCKPFFEVESLSYIPYFCAGILYSRYQLHDWLGGKNIVYTAALVLFVWMTVYVTFYQHNLPFFPYSKIVLPFAGIWVSVCFFGHCLDLESRMGRLFQLLGRRSLEIYLLHFFFAWKMPCIGQWFIAYYDGVGDTRGLFLMQLVLSLSISCVNILLCLGVVTLLEKSKILNLCMLGRKS